jgi:hypothetical protein
MLACQDSDTAQLVECCERDFSNVEQHCKISWSQVSTLDSLPDLGVGDDRLLTMYSLPDFGLDSDCEDAESTVSLDSESPDYEEAVNMGPGVGDDRLLTMYSLPDFGLGSESEDVESTVSLVSESPNVENAVNMGSSGVGVVRSLTMYSLPDFGLDSESEDAASTVSFDSERSNAFEPKAAVTKVTEMNERRQNRRS